MVKREWMYMTCSVDDIHVIRDNTEYNFYNILKGTDDDPNWLSNRHRLALNQDTILGIYYNITQGIIDITKPGFNTGYLKLAIEQYIETNNPKQPDDDTYVIYFRLGDKTVEDNPSVDLLDFDYIDKLLQTNKSEIAVVCCFSFSNIKLDWNYNDSKLSRCRSIMNDILSEITLTVPERQLNIISNQNPDHDICYLYGCDFISHPRSSWFKLFNSL